MELGNIFVFAQDKSLKEEFRPLKPTFIGKPNKLFTALAESDSQTMWIAPDIDFLHKHLVELSATRDGFKDFLVKSNRLPTLLAIGPSRGAGDILLDSIFRRVVVTSPNSYLSNAELAEVLVSENRAGLVIGGQVNVSSDSLYLYKGDLTPVILSLDVFRRVEKKISVDFNKFAVIDFGHTLRFGETEFSVDGLLYEFDSDYRKLLKKQRQSSERSFGASLRRLRMIKGLRQSDFEPGVSEKQIRRLEKNECTPGQATLQKISKVLKVKVGEIGSY